LPLSAVENVEKGEGMKRIGFAAALLVFFLCGPAWADLSWKILSELKLEQEPIDIAASADGRLVFILLPGEIVVYSFAEKSVEKKIPVDKELDRIAYSPNLHALVLTGSSSKTMKVYKLQDIHKLDVSGLPYRGPENAPVTVAVFSDYQ
jgi:hypothetical protein